MEHRGSERNRPPSPTGPLFACDNSMNSSRSHPLSASRATSANARASISWLGARRRSWSFRNSLCNALLSFVLILHLTNDLFGVQQQNHLKLTPTRGRPDRWASLVAGAEGSLIIGDSAIEIQEVDESGANQAAAQQHHHQQQQQVGPQEAPVRQEIGAPTQYEQPSVVLGTTSGNNEAHGLQEASHQGSGDTTRAASLQDSLAQLDANSDQPTAANNEPQPKRAGLEMSRLPSGPLPPLEKHTEDITDGDRRSRGNHDFDLNELTTPTAATSGLNSQADNPLGEVLLGTAPRQPELSSVMEDKTITGKVVDFELQPAGGHNKAKIKKKKKKKMKKGEEKMFKKWDKKKKMEKKAMEKEEKKHMKKKKEEGKKGKKKWGVEEHGQKKKGNFKKKK